MPKTKRGIAKLLLEHLNKKTGRNFKPVDVNVKLISHRLKEYTQDELIKVIDHKVSQWQNTEWSVYLRPSTLFNATKCAQYVGQLPKDKPQEIKKAEIAETDLVPKEEISSFLDSLAGKVRGIPS